jgi:hypothetical protein
MKSPSPFANSRFVGAAVVTGLLLVPLGVFGGSALAHNGGPSAAQYQYKVTICHHTGSKKHPFHTITVSNRAVPAHLKHHDTLGPCSGSSVKNGSPKHSSPNTNGASTSHGNGDHGNGNGKSHDNGDDNGNGNGHDNGHHGK